MDWMQTYSGRLFWPQAPRAEDVRIEDIAHSLALTCRYNGHCRAFYSVAQHSVIVSRAVPDDDALWGLLHDAAEAYSGDVILPLKLSMPFWREIEAPIMRAVCAHFGLAGSEPQSVKRADKRVLANERDDLMAPCPVDWKLTEPRLDIPVITPLGPEAAETAFLARYREIIGDRCVA